MSVDFSNKAAVDKLSKDYIAARDSGDKELAEKLYREIYQMHREMSKGNYTFRKPSKNIHSVKQRNNKKKKVERKNYGAVNTFNLKAFSFILKNKIKEGDSVTVSSSMKLFSDSNGEKIKSALELAYELGILSKKDDIYYKLKNNSDNAYDRLAKIKVKKINANIRRLRNPNILPNFNMKDLSFVLKNRIKKDDFVDVELIGKMFSFSKASRVEAALELACKLGILRKSKDGYLKMEFTPDGSYDALARVKVKDIYKKLRGSNNRTRSREESFSLSVDNVDFQSESVRLNMSDSSYEKGHGRKKREEYDDKKALEFQRSRYGLKDESLLEYDLD